jgi:hypothetical protein
MDPSLDPAAALQPMRDLVARHRGDTTVPTFLGLGTSLADAYSTDVVDRLAGVKRRVDPDGIIRSNRPLG